MNKCISPDASRPSFEDILWNLQYAAQVQATADGDQRTEAASWAVFSNVEEISLIELETLLTYFVGYVKQRNVPKSGQFLLLIINMYDLM